MRPWPDIGSAGADTAWQFPTKNRQLALPAKQVVAAWGETGSDDGSAKLEAYLVRLIRTWRPDVIVTHDASPRGDDPVAYLTQSGGVAGCRRGGLAGRIAGERDRPRALVNKESVRHVAAGAGGGTSITAIEMAPRTGLAGRAHVAGPRLDQQRVHRRPRRSAFAHW